MEKQTKSNTFKRPYVVVEKIFERVALACSKANTGRLDSCTVCQSAGTQHS